eukprot:1303669-Pleurochrysis_carterae.AAC.4
MAARQSFKKACKKGRGKAKGREQRGKKDWEERPRQQEDGEAGEAGNVGWYSEASSLLGHAVATPRTKVRAKAEERTVAERGVTMQIGYSKIRSDLVAGFVKHILQTGSSKNRVKRKS